MVRKSKRSKTSPQKEEPRRRSRMPARTKVRVPVEEDEKEGKWEIPVVGGLLRAFGLRR
jgi:septal ring factor EnvC (AmiA/AmiB activator)